MHVICSQLPACCLLCTAYAFSHFPIDHRRLGVIFLAYVETPYIAHLGQKGDASVDAYRSEWVDRLVTQLGPEPG